MRSLHANNKVEGRKPLLTRLVAPAFDTSPRALLGPGKTAAFPTWTVEVVVEAVFPTNLPAAASEAVEVFPINLG